MSRAPINKKERTHKKPMFTVLKKKKNYGILKFIFSI